jgi:hypothetical protein
MSKAPHFGERVTYFEQPDEPLEARDGDLWVDTSSMGGHRLPPHVLSSSLPWRPPEFNWPERRQPA